MSVFEVFVKLEGLAGKALPPPQLIWGADKLTKTDCYSGKVTA